MFLSGFIDSELRRNVAAAVTRSNGRWSIGMKYEWWLEECGELENAIR